VDRCCRSLEKLGRWGQVDRSTWVGRKEIIVERRELQDEPSWVLYTSFKGSPQCLFGTT